MKAAFSTLGCPDWSLEEALDHGAAYGYGGVELRLLDGRPLEAPSPPAVHARVRSALAGSGLTLVGLGSTIRLAEGEPAALSRELAGYCELAAEWSAPLVRVFGGTLDAAQPRPEALGRIARALEQALHAARQLGVVIAIETHDDFSAAARLAELLALVPDAGVGAIWDVMHTWRMGERPEQVWALLGQRVVDVHVKDAHRLATGRWRQVLLGAGEIDVPACLCQLRTGGYSGWLVTEWEKSGQPHLEEPEVALPQHLQVMRDLWGGSEPAARYRWRFPATGDPSPESVHSPHGAGPER